MVEISMSTNTQEPKYRYDGGRIINRASGEEIPADEPVIIFRARDRRALPMLAHYLSLCADPEHRVAVALRMVDFAIFAHKHRDRMKEPDTDLSPQSGEGG